MVQREHNGRSSWQLISRRISSGISASADRVLTAPAKSVPGRCDFGHRFPVRIRIQFCQPYRRTWNHSILCSWLAHRFRFYLSLSRNRRSPEHASGTQRVRLPRQSS
jgi:hypothetical protein